MPNIRVAQMPAFAKVQRRLHRAAREAGGRAELLPRDYADDAQQADGQPCSNGAEVAQPFADVQPDDVQNQRQRQSDNENMMKNAGLPCSALPLAAANVESVAGGKVQKGRESTTDCSSSKPSR